MFGRRPGDASAGRRRPFGMRVLILVALATALALATYWLAGDDAAYAHPGHPDARVSLSSGADVYLGGDHIPLRVSFYERTRRWETAQILVRFRSDAAWQSAGISAVAPRWHDHSGKGTAYAKVPADLESGRHSLQWLVRDYWSHTWWAWRTTSTTLSIEVLPDPTATFESIGYEKGDADCWDSIADQVTDEAFAGRSGSSMACYSITYGAVEVSWVGDYRAIQECRRHGCDPIDWGLNVVGFVPLGGDLLKGLAKKFRKSDRLTTATELRRGANVRSVHDLKRTELYNDASSGVRRQLEGLAHQVRKFCFEEKSKNWNHCLGARREMQTAEVLHQRGYVITGLQIAVPVGKRTKVDFTVRRPRSEGGGHCIVEARSISGLTLSYLKKTIAQARDDSRYSCVIGAVTATVPRASDVFAETFSFADVTLKDAKSAVKRFAKAAEQVKQTQGAMAKELIVHQSWGRMVYEIPK